MGILSWHIKFSNLKDLFVWKALPGMPAWPSIRVSGCSGRLGIGEVTWAASPYSKTMSCERLYVSRLAIFSWWTRWFCTIYSIYTLQETSGSWSDIYHWQAFLPRNSFACWRPWNLSGYRFRMSRAVRTETYDILKVSWVAGFRNPQGFIMS